MLPSEDRMTDEPNKSGGPPRKPPPRDTLTIPGQRQKANQGKMKKPRPGPIQKPGRRRP